MDRKPQPWNHKPSVFGLKQAENDQNLLKSVEIHDFSKTKFFKSFLIIEKSCINRLFKICDFSTIFVKFWPLSACLNAKIDDVSSQG